MMDHERYQRQIQLRGFGEEGQQKLSSAKVLIIGAGGLGVPVMQYLTGMGIGNLGLVDGDMVSLSNLHRQILYTPEDVGKLKVNCCVSHLQRQNPSISITGYPEFLTTENALSLIGEYDVIVDATDNFTARYLINDACVILDKPFVYGALQQFEGHVSVFNYQGGPTYRCLYPIPPSEGQIPDCNEAGVLGIVPGLIGCFQAMETIKVITGIGTNLSGTLQVHDFLNNSQYTIKLKAKEENKQITTLQGNQLPAFCTPDQEISAKSLLNWLDHNKALNLLDVREIHEFQKGHLSNALSIPLSRINNKLPDLPMDRPWVLLCQQGGRSRKVLQHFKKLDPSIQLLNLEGGMTGWIKNVGQQYISSL
jgi:adenylyltransferase/sulfurtransferase